MPSLIVACERSNVVRDEFAALGWDAWSCDLEEAERGGKHIRGDAQEAVRSRRWDLMIAHPPCTYIASSGLHWNHRTPGRDAKTDEAVRFVLALAGADIPLIAIENPIGCLSTRWREPDQIIQPWQFGDDASKATCLWIKGLPTLAFDAPLFRPTVIAPPRMVNGRPRWSNQTDSGQNKLGPSPTRQTERSRTYIGIARAMAEQWGSLR